MTRRRQFGSIRRLPSGRYQARYRDPTGSQQTQTFATRGDASRWLARVQVDIERGAWTDPTLAATTFGAWCKTYFDTAQNKRPATLVRERRIVSAHLEPRFGARSLGSVTPLDVREWVDALASKYTPRTTRRYYAMLRAILRAAVEADMIVRTPCRGITLPTIEGGADRPLLGPKELARLAAAMPADQRAMVYLGGVLGLRYGEVAGLRVGRLDFFANTLTVAESVSEAEGVTFASEPKTAAGRRTLTVPKPLMDMLAPHLALRGRPAPDEYVFVAPGAGPLSYSNWRSRSWLPAIKKAKLPGLTFHGLRHSATTAMVAQGEHPRVIQHRLGHSTARLSQEVYAHVPTELDRAAADRLTEQFFGASGTQVARIADAPPA